MKRPRRIVTEHTQSWAFTRRAMLLNGVQLGLGGLLISRAGWLAIAQNEKYSLLSESNRLEMTLIPPRRGWIIDRYGKPLAVNRSDFRIDIIPNRLQNREETLASLQQIIGYDESEAQRILEDLEKAGGYQPVQIASNLSFDKYAAISVRLPELPGVAPTDTTSRYYPTGAAVGHLLGYVGAPSAEEYEKTKNPLYLTPGYKVGKGGIEKSLHTLLEGKPGMRRQEVTARGKLVRDLDTIPDKIGNTLQMTIDAGLQDYAARRMGENSGACVVIDTHNGDILALASMPSYDPNSFSDGISHDEWNMLSEDDHLPLLNKVLQGLYPPGSTWKPISTLAFLKAGIKPEETVVCTGRYKVGNSYFHCAKRRGHGAISMERALIQSCDIYYYALARRVGPDMIAHVAQELGMGQEHDLPVPSQRYGTVPYPAWLEKKHNRKWSEFDTINSSIGQGYVLASPLQLTLMAARIASGKKLEPKLVLKRKKAAADPFLNINPEHLAFVRNALAQVTVSGTAAAAQIRGIEGVKMAGKTGTAQVRRISMAERRSGVRSNAQLPWKFRDHALFISFAPTDNPRYACAVVLEHGGWGASAAPIARDVLTYLFDKEKAMTALLKLETDWGGDIKTRMDRKTQAWKAAKIAEANAAAGIETNVADAEAEKEDETKTEVTKTERGDIDAIKRPDPKPLNDISLPPADAPELPAQAPLPHDGSASTANTITPQPSPEVKP